jgi:CMP-N-acetylneuraminic acid synthetase
MRVAIIPARGGSRRIPRKNIRPFFGKPIIAYSIETAKASGLFDQVVVSSDDLEIRETARRFGALAIERDPVLSVDMVGTQMVTASVLMTLAGLPGFDGVVMGECCCIYPCAPMMTTEDLRVAHDVMVTDEKYACIEGWFYFGMSEWFLRDKPLGDGCEFIVEAERYIDINTPEDWKRAEAMFAALYSKTT